MLIPVKVKSNITGRIARGSFTARHLLDFLDEDELITNLTMCNCQPIGETNYTECNCGDEWMDCEVWIGDEIN